MSKRVWDAQLGQFRDAGRFDGKPQAAASYDLAASEQSGERTLRYTGEDLPDRVGDSAQFVDHDEVTLTTRVRIADGYRAVVRDVDLETERTQPRAEQYCSEHTYLSRHVRHLVDQAQCDQCGDDWCAVCGEDLPAEAPRGSKCERCASAPEPLSTTIQPGRSETFSVEDYGFQDDGDVTVERMSDGQLRATTTVTMTSAMLTPEDVPTSKESEWIREHEMQIRDYMSERYGAESVDVMRGKAEVTFATDLRDDAAPADAFSALASNTKARFLRYELRTQADGNLDVPTNWAIADYVQDAERLNDIQRNCEALARGWKVGNFGKPHSRLRITPAADQTTADLTIRVTRGDQEGFSNDGSADLEARVVYLGESPKGYHGNDLRPEWSLAHPNGEPFSPEENTEFLEAMGEKVTNRPNNPASYEGPRAALNAVSEVMSAWRAKA